MTTITRHLTIPYTAEEMYRLVDDIEHYPDFLPWCRKSTVLIREGDQVKATLEIGMEHLNQSFTTLNQGDRPTRITMELLDGPFSELQGVWVFDEAGEQGCRVSLDLRFSFKNPILGMTLGRVFEGQVSTLVDAFLARAKAVYGER